MRLVVEGPYLHLSLIGDSTAPEQDPESTATVRFNGPMIMPFFAPFRCSEPQDSTAAFQNRSITERNQIRDGGSFYK